MKKTARAHKKRSKREIRMEKTASASIAIGELEKGHDVFILTFGQFSLIDALIAILHQTGPADVIISTWTAAHAHLEKTAELMMDANIRSLRMIVDRSFKTRQPEYFAHMIERFGAESIRETVTHAKFMTIRNDKWNIVVRTSMNLNENPRLENIEISDDEKFADFFESVTDEIFAEIAPLEKQKSLPKLENIENSVVFPRVEAGTISVSKLKEASYGSTVSK